MTKKIDEKTLMEILEAIAKAYNKAGRKVKFATLYDEENPEGLILVPPDSNAKPELEFETDEQESEEETKE